MSDQELAGESTASTGNSPIAQVDDDGATNGLTVAALVLGILSVILIPVAGGIVLGIPALVFGYRGRRQIHNNGGRGNGQGLAGIILGWVALPLSIVVTIFVVIGVVGNVSRPNTGSTGAALYGDTISGQPVTLTWSKFVDPAKDNNGYTSDNNSNDHYATFWVRITNRGNTDLYMTGSTGSFLAIAYSQSGTPSENVSATPSFNTLCPTGSQANGIDNLAPGTSAYLCFGFVLPEATTVSKVEVTPTQGSGAGSDTWTVNDTFGGWSN